MKVQVENVSDVKKKLAISIPEEEVASQLDQAYKKVGRQARIPGFRPGKAPRKVLEQRFGSSVEAEVYEDLVRRTITEALEDHKLQAVAVPEILKPKREKGSGFSYEASVEVKPSFEPKDYVGVKILKTKTTVTEKQLKEVFERLQDTHAVMKDREGATKPVDGDFVMLLIQGTDEEGNLSAPTEEPKEQLYEIGGEILQADIEKAVKKLPVGATAPATVETKTRPKEGEKEETKELHFKVTLKAIKEKILPSLDDEFAKAVGPFEDLKALTEGIKKDLKEEMEEKAKAESVQKILETLREKNKFEIPESLVERELHGLMHGFYNQMQRAGLKEIPPEYSEEKLREKMKPDAERRVHEQLLIEAIADKEGITVDDGEIEKRIGKMAKEANVPVAEFRSYYEKTNQIDSMQFQMLAQKTLDFLFVKATIK